MPFEKQIVIRGAREHNLQNISLEIPRDRLVVITGLSGSGKSSLAFDTIYAEGQRRYLESLSAYARQFMEQMRKPEVDSIEGLSPSISIEQKNISRNPRSTVGTVTEIYDFLRLLFARAGTPHCISCGKPIRTQTISQISEHIQSWAPGTKFSILAPIVRGKKGEYQKELLELRSKGFVRARIDGEEVSLATPIKLQKHFKHDISVYIDRLVIRQGIEGRLMEALELAHQLSEGVIEVENLADSTRKYFATKFACPDCGTSFNEIEPRNFSFNSSHGACPQCAGVGSELQIDPHRVIPNPSLSLSQGAIHPWIEKPTEWKETVISGLAKHFKFDPEIPFESLPQKTKEAILYGTGADKIEFNFLGKKKRLHQFNETFEGVITSLQALLKESQAEEEVSDEISPYLSHQTCQTCQGSRLKKESQYVRVSGKSITEITDLPIDDCLKIVSTMDLSIQHQAIADPILKEITARLQFLRDVGLSYLTLARSAASLSGGEAQRIRLATQVGSNLVGVLYVLDEPSIGLHQRDNEKLLKTLERLRDEGNSVLVVEHDEDTIRRADFVVDLGPGAGKQGGNIVFIGSPKELSESSTLTGQYLSRLRTIPVPAKRRVLPKDRRLRIFGAKQHNLKGVNFDLPLGTFTVVTGVSGSGKSSLILDTLLEAAQQHFSRFHIAVTTYDRIEGLDHLERVIHVDQSPIGRTPRSNPATYTGLFTEIRNLFAQTNEAKVRGYTISRFSFNVAGGRCESCSGDGNLRISMHFLPDVFVACEVCQGRRYNRETLEVRFHGKNIADVLEMTIDEAYEFFERIPSIKPRLQVLKDVGLGYIHLGQTATTLSGGEAQRMKLSRELGKRGSSRTLYILDEPTTGLHFEDVRKLVEILHRLVDQGSTVIVIEHNLDIIKQADYLVDLGPEGGEGGGRILFQGRPEDLPRQKASHTGKYLNKVLTTKESKDEEQVTTL